MKRLLLLTPVNTYRIADFLTAAYALELPVEVVVANEERSSVEHLSEGHLMQIPLSDLGSAVAIIEAAHRDTPFDAIVPVDTAFLEVAAEACRALGLSGNPPGAVRLAADKLASRQRLVEAGVPGPAFLCLDRAGDRADGAARVSAEVGFPCVLKPLGLSGSRGVIRADGEAAFIDAFDRIDRLLAGLEDADDPVHASILVEAYMEGGEVAVEGLLDGGALEVLAIFDKPDPLTGPFFEETIYVTPSRLPESLQRQVGACVAEAAWALGLSEGPIHAEVRLTDEGPRILEVAARSIGGLCARTLVFATGLSLEGIILRQALGLSTPLSLGHGAAGVMMIPIPAAGILKAVHDQRARAVPGVEDVVITHPLSEIEPLPEGSSYLGFIFGRAERPDEVEEALREAHRRLEIVIEQRGMMGSDRPSPHHKERG